MSRAMLRSFYGLGIILWVVVMWVIGILTLLETGAESEGSARDDCGDGDDDEDGSGVGMTVGD